jgi:hypothetical protein
LLHHHQTGAAAKEDFIGGSLFDPRSGDPIKDRQQPARLLGGGLRPPPQLGHTGGTLREEWPQQTPGDGQADAFRLSRGGEAGEGVGIENDGLLELSVEAVPLGTETVVVLLKVLKPLLVVGAVHGLKDLGSVAVECLPRSAGEGGLSGNGPVGSIKDGGGVGDTKVRR